MEDAACNQEFVSAPLAGQEVPVGKVCDIVIHLFRDTIWCYSVKLLISHPDLNQKLCVKKLVVDIPTLPALISFIKPRFIIKRWLSGYSSHQLSAPHLVEMEECAILLVSVPALAAGEAADAKEVRH